jgi:hypothetical protein
MSTPPTTSHGGAPGQVPYPWDDITELDDAPGTAWHDIAWVAVGLMCFMALVCVLAFSLGVLTGMSGC